MAANNIHTKSLCHHQINAFHVLGLFSLLLMMMQTSVAYQFKVGGSKGWSVPADPNVASFNQWAERNRFQIGDTLLFVYPPDQDSVLHVTKEDYTNCNTGTPLEKFTDGHTVFQFNQSGPYYFISGAGDNCHKNEKLVLVVMADRNNRSYQGGAGSPPPTSEASPSPAPAGEESPSPPSGPVGTPPSPSPSPTGETPPSPSPTGETTPPSGASSMVTSFIGSAGALFASSLVLVF